MGNFCSSVSTKVKTGDARKSRMNQRISLSLEKIKEESAKKNDSKVMTLEKIILRFDRFRSVLKLIKDVFHDISGGRSLDFEGLHRAMSKLHGALEKEEVRNLFDFIDLDDSHEIELKEFLVALVIGYVLDAVPTKNQNEDESGPNVERQVSRMRAGSEELNAGGLCPAYGVSGSCDQEGSALGRYRRIRPAPGLVVPTDGPSVCGADGAAICHSLWAAVLSVRPRVCDQAMGAAAAAAAAAAASSTTTTTTSTTATICFSFVGGVDIFRSFACCSKRFRFK